MNLSIGKSSLNSSIFQHLNQCKSHALYRWVRKQQHIDMDGIPASLRAPVTICKLMNELGIEGYLANDLICLLHDYACAEPVLRCFKATRPPLAGYSRSRDDFKSAMFNVENSAKRIQHQWHQSINNPQYTICRNRLKKEFDSM